MLTVDHDQKSSEYRFHDTITLSEEAEKLGKKAVQLGIISGFTVQVFSDCWLFTISNSNDQKSKLMTPPEAYLRLRKLVEQ